MSNKLSDVIHKLQELEKINPDATVIIPGCDFYDHNIKAIRVKKDINYQGKQYHSSYSYSKDDFNAVILAADQTKMPEKSIYRTMNKDIPEQMDYTLFEFIKTLEENVEEEVSNFLERNYTTGTVYFFDRDNWYTCERDLLDIFPRLRQIRGWQHFLFKIGTWKGFKKSIVEFGHMLDMFGEEDSVKRMKNAKRYEIPPPLPGTEIEGLLRRSFPKLMNTIAGETEKNESEESEESEERTPRVVVIKNPNPVHGK